VLKEFFKQKEDKNIDEQRRMKITENRNYWGKYDGFLFKFSKMQPTMTK
jgi:hypothetical protein